MSTDIKYRSRKFMLSMFIQASATVGVFFNFIDSGDFATISSVNIGAYSFANAYVNKKEQSDG